MKLQGNILYQFTIHPDERKLMEVSKYIKNLKWKMNVFRVFLGVIAVMLLIALLYMALYVEGPYVFFIQFITIYVIIFLVGLLLFKAKMLIAIRYNVYVHETPGRQKVRSIIIVPEYFPKGKEIVIIPIEMISKIGIIETKKRLGRQDVVISGLEVFILDRKGRELLKFGFLGREDEIKNVATDLWAFVTDYKSNTTD